MPFLAYSAERDYPEAQAPSTAATYSIQVSCPGCSFPAYTGSLVGSPRNTATQPTYLLPLTQETVPALAQLPASPATLSLSVTFTDSVGNSGTLTHSVEFHVIGPPLVVLKDNGCHPRRPQQRVRLRCLQRHLRRHVGRLRALRLPATSSTTRRPSPSASRSPPPATGPSPRTGAKPSPSPRPSASPPTASPSSAPTTGWPTRMATSCLPTPRGRARHALWLWPGLPDARTYGRRHHCLHLQGPPRPVSRDLPRSGRERPPHPHDLPVSSGYESDASAVHERHLRGARAGAARRLPRPHPRARALPSQDLANSRGSRIQLWHYDYWVPTGSELQLHH
ncbi:hypothetical protein ACN28S_67750 [Cystobacter fuscus]